MNTVNGGLDCLCGHGMHTETCPAYAAQEARLQEIEKKLKALQDKIDYYNTLL